MDRVNRWRDFGDIGVWGVAQIPVRMGSLCTHSLLIEFRWIVSDDACRFACRENIGAIILGVQHVLRNESFLLPSLPDFHFLQHFLRAPIGSDIGRILIIDVQPVWHVGCNLFVEIAIRPVKGFHIAVHEDRHDARVILLDSEQVLLIGIQVGWNRKIILFLQILPVNKTAGYKLLIGGWNGVDLAVYLHRIPVILRNELLKLRRCLGKQLIQGQESALLRVRLILRPVGRINQVNRLAGGQQQLVFLIPIRPGCVIEFDRRIQVFLGHLVNLSLNVRQILRRIS
ncbi:hypothetical protein D3C81_1238070 [compost metagenome]